MTDSKQMCTFYIGEHFFGIDAARVQEILRRQPITPVPLAPRVIRGLLNLRGQIIVAFDLRSIVGGTKISAGEPDQMNVVVRARSGPISLLVERVGEVLDVSQDDFEPPPKSTRGSRSGLILGAYKLKSALLIALDLESIVNIQDMNPVQPDPVKELP